MKTVVQKGLWIINFRTGEDTGPRLRNSAAECFTIDASSFLYIIADAQHEEDLKIEHK